MEGLSRQPGTPARENGSRLFNGFVIYSPYDVGGRCAVPFDIGLRYGKGEDGIKVVVEKNERYAM